MKVSVKTLKGIHFEIDVNPEDKVAEVKKKIETTQGQSVYPAEQQLLIHQGKILKDDTTLHENNVVENSFIVIMLTKTKGSSSGASTATTSPPSQPKDSSTEVSAPSVAPPSVAPPRQDSAVSSATTQSSTREPSSAVVPTPTVVSVPTVTPTPSATATPAITETTGVDIYSQAASNLVAGSNLEQTIQSILDIGGGTWDRETVVRALHAAYNNPERAVDYLYSGIPEQAELPSAARAPSSEQTTNPPVQAAQPSQPAAPPSVPNASPLDLFPQGLPSMGSNTGAGSLGFLRNSPQFRALQAVVQANPQILQPVLRELGKQNPQIMRLIQEHQAEFLELLNEPAEGAESNLVNQLASAMPQALTVTPEEREAIERLEAMGFDRALVLEVFFACNKNEELAANYLLDHMHEFDER